jgi:hypothetical protein
MGYKNDGHSLDAVIFAGVYAICGGLNVISGRGRCLLRMIGFTELPSGVKSPECDETLKRLEIK